MMNKNAWISVIAVTGISATSIFVLAVPAKALILGTDWTSGTSGDLNGVTVNLSNISGTGLGRRDLSGADYSAAPLSSSQEIVTYRSNSNWTATFSSPVSNLLLYPVFWRGVLAGGPDPVTYTFDQSFAILSGLSGASVAGNALSAPQSSFHNGVIQFTGPVSSLNVTTSATTTSTSEQALTFGVDTATPVPFDIPGGANIPTFGSFFALALMRKAKKIMASKTTHPNTMTVKS